jgi:hypothetical protein
MMKLFIAALALAATSFAAPSPHPAACTPGTYACKPGGGNGWVSTTQMICLVEFLLTFNSSFATPAVNMLMVDPAHQRPAVSSTNPANQSTVSHRDSNSHKRLNGNIHFDNGD